MRTFKQWVAYRKLWRPRIVQVNQSLDLRQRIEACGFSRFDHEILEDKFPVVIADEILKVQVFFYHRPFKLDMTTREAISRIKVRGGVPIGLDLLLAIAEQTPNLQRSCPIVALGSVCKSQFMERDGFALPLLIEIGGDRELSLSRCLDPMCHKWAADYRFPYIKPESEEVVKHELERIFKEATAVKTG